MVDSQRTRRTLQHALPAVIVPFYCTVYFCHTTMILTGLTGFPKRMRSFTQPPLSIIDHLFLFNTTRVTAPTAQHLRPPLIATPTYNKTRAATFASLPTSSPSTPSTASIATSRSIVTMASATSFWDFTPKDKTGADKPLSEYKGKVVLVVNTASKCGFTPQFAGLEKLYKDITATNPDDFVILGFPCNQFASQDPGSNDEIQEFCQVNYGVTFPIFGKVDVNGDKPEPVWNWLKNEQAGVLGIKRVKWNFEKFLIGRDGKVKGRWASTTKPEALEKPIKEQIAVPAKE
ncbi:thioredoxin-like protein [Xylaria scruposa]|nr:thioredoxin-like protein [Xylaria scruposa]